MRVFDVVKLYPQCKCKISFEIPGHLLSKKSNIRQAIENCADISVNFNTEKFTKSCKTAGIEQNDIDSIIESHSISDDIYLTENQTI
ncbi:MAG: hypothetical protein ACD_79C00949G0002 [uncultured bacterium]|nr:MAG: hypothetical protein ACD_79C00949G0002 [uncultured bacterium]